MPGPPKGMPPLSPPAPTKADVKRKYKGMTPQEIQGRTGLTYRGMMAKGLVPAEETKGFGYKRPPPAASTAWGRPPAGMHCLESLPPEREQKEEDEYARSTEEVATPKPTTREKLSPMEPEESSTAPAADEVAPVA